MQQIILASESPRRRELMKLLGIPFKVVKSDYKEDLGLPLPPTKLVQVLALGKAKAVVNKYPNALIVAADSVVASKGKVMGKPKSKVEAMWMLRRISGQMVGAITGVAVLDAKKNKKSTFAVDSKITFRVITPKEIDWYIKTGEPMDKAGAFAVQGKGAMFIKSVVGERNTAIGLPVLKLAMLLRKFGVKV